MSLKTVENVCAMYDLPNPYPCPHCKVPMKWEAVIETEKAIGVRHPVHEPCGENYNLIKMRVIDPELEAKMKRILEAR